MLEVCHVKKKDLVQVMTGKERGKTGKVLRVHHKSSRVVVEKLNIIKRHTRPTGKTPGGIVEKEAPIAASNVLLYCEKCGKGRRTVVKKSEKAKLRHCRKCNTALDK
ncbi:MAG: 50S ribosomal protein L24 [Deltaproteobacteria bacterium]|nr:50S ribosomal protein L24 [Deltaproteobacteria bacterium]MBI3293533.1 50S ribosomal protein L24 [Deltaproteobacteria bacterium]